MLICFLIVQIQVRSYENDGNSFFGSKNKFQLSSTFTISTQKIEPPYDYFTGM
jgi:hypothetical protein